MSELVNVSRRGDALLVALNDPAHHNAVSLEVIQTLHEAVMRASREGARQFVFHGKGPSFSSGANMGEYLRTLDEIETGATAAFRESEYQLMDIARLLRRPTTFSVAAVHGWCIGLGAELAIACDFVVAADDATFWFPETKAGWNAGMGTVNHLTRTVGAGWAKRMLLLGDKLPAKDAHAAGLVARIASQDKVVDEALKVLDTMRSRSPLAVQYQKRLLDILPNVALEDSMELETICGFWLAHSRDVREAAKAYVERREPQFQGR